MTTRHDTLFQIGYSIRLEKMQATFLNRLDRSVSMAQFALSAAVITSLAPVSTGILLAILTAYMFVFQPGARSAEARAQKQRYEELLADADAMADDELHRHYRGLQERDSQVLGSLQVPAHLGEQIRLGGRPVVDLSLMERIAAFIAGDVPRLPKES